MSGKLKWLVTIAGIWLLLPMAVLFSWPVVLWWIARLLSRSAQPWFTAVLAIIFGVQIGVLVQRPLGLDILLFGGTTALLELWNPGTRSWQRYIGDIVFGAIFCAVFLIAGLGFTLTIWLIQILILVAVNAIELGAVLWWRQK